MSRGLSTEWTRGVPEDERKDFEKLVRGNTLLLSRLLQIIEQRLVGITKEEGKFEIYSDGYPFKQAYLNGKKVALRDLKALLSFMED